MSFSETIFLFFLALIIFGPKKLPEIARQAGRLLAELRRASNEFKSQIETEISHLEVKQRAEQRETNRTESEKTLTALTPNAAPQGTVASLSLNPASGETAPQSTSATLAAPRAETGSQDSADASNAIAESEAVAAVNDPASQASHV
ncbi:MAG TPA: twin-arginine translocase TatA/TatE family subunit [Candidatus Aquilonibacter sp.]|nr:twin-arginine translocase TatA/TatE family subunit [Candidatus Aquilonibacter sp.]